MKRAKWHDFVIVFSILALFGAGVGAIWGGEIREAIDGLMDSGQGAHEAPAKSAPPPGTHKDLL